MTPHFAKAVDPVFECLLRIVDQVEGGQPCDPEDQQRQISLAFERAQAEIGESEEWPLAKYALACWIDEILTRQPWAGRTWWIGNPLERKLFARSDAATLFFDKARQAATMRDRNALEVFYICVVLGFRGVYERPDLEGLIREHELPDRLPDWLAQTGDAIRVKPGRPSLPRPFPIYGPGAPPREGRSWMIGAWILTALVLCGAGLLVFYSFLARFD